MAQSDIMTSSDYDRAKELKQFDETKAGVKGLLESGVTKVPRFLIYTPQEDDDQTQTLDDQTSLEMPVIDLSGHDDPVRHDEIVMEIRKASETWGFFKMVNHGVSLRVMENLLEGVRKFNEQPKEMRMEWYSRDPKKHVRYYCNGSLFETKTIGWRDSIAFDFRDGPLDPLTLPSLCREEVGEYMKGMEKLREVLVEMMSEALGLPKDYLEKIECMKSQILVCHYYPVCPEPDLTIGATKHSDPSALTFLLQDQTGGLQVLHNNRWIDVTPSPNALIAHVGDFMQLMTNDKFKSVEHRVLAGKSGARVSAACFFYPTQKNRPYSPIKELLSDQQLPKYRQTDISHYLSFYKSIGLDGIPALPFFKL